MTNPIPPPLLTRAREVLDIEIAGLTRARGALGDSFVQTVERILATLANNGKIVVTGIGKSFLIAEKISATLASTGSTSVVLNPVQAMHGDLGIVTQNDILLALSYSGESDELIALMPAIKRRNIPVVALTGNAESSLAKLSDITLLIDAGHEACPFKLAPTTSTTATLAVGDALAMVLIDARGFTQEDYAKNHPAGAIGRALLLTVRDVMRSGEKIAALKNGATVQDAVIAMTRAQSGCACVVDAQGALLGIFTDGDLRRGILRDPGFLTRPVSAVMTASPKCARDGQSVVEVSKVFDRHKIDDLPVVDSAGRLVGCVDIQDLPRMKTC